MQFCSIFFPLTFLIVASTAHPTFDFFTNLHNDTSQPTDSVVAPNDIAFTCPLKDTTTTTNGATKACEDPLSKHRGLLVDCRIALGYMVEDGHPRDFHHKPPSDLSGLPWGISYKSCKISADAPTEDPQWKSKWTWTAMKGYMGALISGCMESPEQVLTTGGFAFVGPNCDILLIVQASFPEGESQEGEEVRVWGNAPGVEPLQGVSVTNVD